jgi:hypothetical protein
MFVILWRVKWLDTGFGLVIGSIGLLQTLTAINYSAKQNSDSTIHNCTQ